MYFRGEPTEYEKILQKTLKNIEENDYEISGDILIILRIDTTITSKKDEFLNEIQRPVTKIINNL